MTPTLSTIRDLLDRLASETASGDAAFSRVYFNDALGRRATTTTTEGTVRHVYDGIHCIADIGESNAVLRSYVWGPGIDNLLAVVVPSGGGARPPGEPCVYYALTDHQNTVHGFADTPDVTYIRDRLGNVLSAVCDGVSTNRYAYNRTGQVTNEWQNGVSLTRDYDGLGREAGYWIDGAESSRVAYAYDEFGRFSSVGFSTDHAEYIRVSGSDLIAGYTIGEFRRSVGYEPHRDLIATVTNTFGANLVSAFDYESDAAGRRVSRLDWYDGSVTTNLFGYNGRSELTSAQMGTNSFAYAYDPIGNRTETQENSVHSGYTANELNQYTLISSNGISHSPTYDVDGNMTSDGDGWAYIWNGENRMVMASNDTACVTYAYDERGRIAHKNSNIEGTPFVSCFPYYDGFRIIQERFVSGMVVNKFDNIWGMDILGTLHDTAGTGGLLGVSEKDNFMMMVADGMANVTDWFSTDSNNDRHTHSASVFGDRLNGRNDENIHWGFSTHKHDVLLELVEYPLRKYNPNLGRWLSRDPYDSVPETETLSLNSSGYCFCRNSPLSFIDDSGKIAIAIPVMVDIGEYIVTSLAAAIVTAMVLDSIDECRKSRPREKFCLPCIPDVNSGIVAYRIDRVPPGTLHSPFVGDHVHIYHVNQIPLGAPDECTCYWNSGKHDVIGGNLPPAGSIPYTGPRAEGGGVGYR